MGKLIFILIIFAILTGCTGEKKIKHGSLVLVDSLDISEDIDHCLTACMTQHLYEDELYVLDSHTINVYDAKNFEFKRSFGKAGKGPGEFFYAQDFCIKNDTVFVADSGNFRVQFFSLDGTYLSMVKYRLPWIINHTDNRMLISPPTLKNGSFISEYKNGDFEKIYDIDSLLAQNKMKKTQVNFLSFEGKILLTIPFEGGQIYEVNENNEMSLLNLNSILKTLNINKLTEFGVKEGKLYLIAQSYTDTETDEEWESSEQIKRIYNIKEYLFVVNKDLEIEQQYMIPDEYMPSLNTLIVDKDTILISDIGTSNIYRFRMEF